MSEQVRVAVDFTHPAAYLAVEPIRALESRLGRTFEWLPYKVPSPPRPKAASEGNDRASRHQRVRAEYLARDLRRYAQARGLELGELQRAVDTTSASLGLLWLRRRAPTLASGYAARIFDRIWRENAAADAAFVEQALGADAPGFRDYAVSDGPSDLAAVRAELEALALWTVPGFIVNDELFLGRQHLPMVEGLATGRVGAPPI